MAVYVNLRKFKESELIFDDEETKIILKFFFTTMHSQISVMQVTKRVREFAQGLLLEAVDASYSLGFIDALFGSSINPGAGAMKVIKKFAKKAFKHWFKHANEDDLLKIKIYDIVRQRIESNFGTIMQMYISGAAMINLPHTVAFDYDEPTVGSKIWG